MAIHSATTVRKSPKWKRRPSARPSEIADAALDVFASKGYEAATMDEIAEAARISKGTIYLYFPSKEDLLVASIEGRMRRNLANLWPLQDSARKPLTREIVRAEIEGALERLIDIFNDEQTRKVLRVLLAERPKSPKLRERHGALALEMHDRLAEFLRNADRAGVMECARPVEIARALFGMIIIFPITEELFGARSDGLRSKAARRAVTSLALKGIGLD